MLQNLSINNYVNVYKEIASKSQLYIKKSMLIYQKSEMILVKQHLQCMDSKSTEK